MPIIAKFSKCLGNCSWNFRSLYALLSFPIKLTFHHFFFPYRSPPCKDGCFLYQLTENIEMALYIYMSENFYSFGDFNARHHQWIFIQIPLISPDYWLNFPTAQSFSLTTNFVTHLSSNSEETLHYLISFLTPLWNHVQCKSIL